MALGAQTPAILTVPDQQEAAQQVVSSSYQLDCITKVLEWKAKREQEDRLAIETFLSHHLTPPSISYKRKATRLPSVENNLDCFAWSHNSCIEGKIVAVPPKILDQDCLMFDLNSR